MIVYVISVQVLPRCMVDSYRYVKSGPRHDFHLFVDIIYPVQDKDLYVV